MAGWFFLQTGGSLLAYGISGVGPEPCTLVLVSALREPSVLPGRAIGELVIGE